MSFYWPVATGINHFILHTDVNAEVQDYRGLCLVLQDSTLTLGLQGASKDLVVS